MKKSINNNFIKNYLKYTFKINFGYYRIGFIIIFINVFLIFFLNESKSILNNVFLNFVERTVGDTDFIYYSNSLTNINLNDNSSLIDINNKTIDVQQLEYDYKDMDDIKCISGRWVFPINSYNNNITADNLLLLMNTRKEKMCGFGRNLNYPALNNSEVLISEELFYLLGFNEDKLNNRVKIKLDFGSILTNLEKNTLTKTIDQILYSENNNNNLKYNKLIFNNEEINNNLKSSNIADYIITQLNTTNNYTFIKDYKIKYIFESPKGLYPNIQKSTLIIDIDEFKIDLINYINTNLVIEYPYSEIIKTIIKSYNNFPIANILLTNKMKVYKDFNRFEKNIIRLSNTLKLNSINNYKLSGPIYKGLFSFKYASMILTIILNNIILFLVIITIIVLYSLIKFNIEKNNYEYGMLRALGLRMQKIKRINFYKTIYFSIPSTITALIVAFILSQLVLLIISNIFKNEYYYNFSYFYFSIAILEGILLPIFVSFNGIKSALQKNLRQALEIFNKDMSKYFISIVKLQKIGISTSEIFISMLFIFYGISFFYFIPYSMVNMNFELFLQILYLIIFLMIVGFIIISNFFKIYIQKLFSIIIILPFSNIKKCKKIIFKNIDAHNNNSSKAYFVLLLVIVFIIFCESSIKINCKTLINTSKMFYGGDIYASSNDNINITEFKSKMDKFIKEYPDYINGYALLNQDLNKIKFIDNIQISALNNYNSIYSTVNVLNPNYLETIYTDILDIPNTNRLNGIKSFLSDNNKIDYKELDPNSILSNKIDKKEKYKRIKLITSTGMKGYMGIEKGSLISMTINTNLKKYIFECEISEVANIFPGYTFSKYESKTSQYKPFIINEFDYKYINKIIIDDINALNKTELYRLGITNNSDDNYNNSEFISKEVRIKFKQIPSNIIMIKIISIIKNSLNNPFIMNNINNEKDINMVIKYFDLFNIFLLSVSIFICFFMLLIYFVKNIKENIWELAVLRSLGLRKDQALYMYIIENVSLIFTSIFIGTIIGISISILSNLQFNIILESPFIFIFPINSFIFILVFSIIIALAITIIGIMKYLSRPISSILKGLK